MLKSSDRSVDSSCNESGSDGHKSVFNVNDFFVLLSVKGTRDGV